MINLCKKSTEKNLKETVDRAAAKLQDIAKQARTKYEQTDEATKKKIAAALAGAAVLIAAAIGVKKILKKK